MNTKCTIVTAVAACLLRFYPPPTGFFSGFGFGVLVGLLACFCYDQGKKDRT